MAQKPLFKNGKKKLAKALAANRHGKVEKTQKGNLSRPAKNEIARQAVAEQQEISKVINKRIEEQAAAAAVQNGLRLSTVRPGRPRT